MQNEPHTGSFCMHGVREVVPLFASEYFDDDRSREKCADENGQPAYNGNLQDVIFPYLDFAQGAACQYESRMWTCDLRHDDGTTNTRSGTPGNSILAVLAHIVKNTGGDGRCLTV